MSFVNVPSFVLASGVPVRLGARTIPVDVAFGGAFYAIVDAETAGLPIDPYRLTDLRATGMAIKRAVESPLTVVHPTEPGLTGIYGTIFTGPATKPGADLRNVTIFAEAEVDRSPCGTGTCAVLAVLDAMGLRAATPFVHESIIGTTFTRAGRRTARRSATFPPSFPSYPAKPGSRENTRSSWMTKIRCVRDSDSELTAVASRPAR